MKRFVMKPWLRRALLVTGIVLIVMAVGIVGVSAWLVSTQRGLEVVVSTGVKRSPVTIHVERVEGRVLGPLRLSGVEIEHGESRLHLAEAVLDWDPRALWSRRLHVRSLVLDDLAVELGEPDPDAPPPETKPFELPEIELPVTVVVDTFRLRGITLRQAGRRDSIAIGEVALDGLQYKDSLGVQRFALATPWGELGFRGWVRTRGAYPLDLAIQWTLTPPDLPRVTGHGTIAGNLDTLVIRQNVTAPARAFASVQIESLTTRLRFDLTARLEPLDLRSLKKDAPQATISGALAARGDLVRQDVTMNASYASRETGPWSLEADGHAEMPDVEVSRLALAQRGSRARVNASGSAHLDSAHTTFAARATWSELAWPPVGKPSIALPRGRLDGEGEAGRWTVAMRTDVRTPQGIEESLRASGFGDTTSFVLESLAGSLLGGEIDASGRVAWSPAIAWKADVAMRELNVGMLAPEWPSNLGAHLTTEGRMRGAHWAARVEVSELDGTLREKPLAGRVHLEGEKGGTALVDTDVQYAGASFAAKGSALAPIDLAWTLDVPSLAEFDTTLAGALKGSGRLEGRDTLAVASASLEGTELVLAGSRVAGLVLEARVDRTNDDALDLTVAARDIEAPPLAPVDSVRVTASGTREGYRFAVALESALRRLAASGTAAPRDSAWAGRIDRLDLAVAKNPPWRLDSPAPFEVGPSRGSVGPLALRAGPARLDADADWRTGGDVRVRAELASFPLANLHAFLPESLRVEGALSMTSDAVMHADGVLDARLALAPLHGKVTWHDREPIEVAFEDVKLELESSAPGLTVRGGAVLPELGRATTDLALPGFRWNRVDSTQAIEGTLTAEAREWKLVEQLTDELEEIAGKLTADMRWSGTLGTPRVGGEVRFENGAFDVPAVGLEIRELSLDAKADTDGKWRLDSSLRSGKGSFAAKADADLSNAKHPRATIAMTGQDFLLIDIPEARVIVSPDLSVKVEGERVDVGGSLTVPSAKVDAGNKMIALAVPPSPDVIVPRERADSTVIPFELHTDVRLTLGDDVSFKGYGIAAEPEGSVRITQKPNKPALGQGELELETGTYSGYGRDLKIERGRLVYAGGPVDDPEVAIRASREIENEDITVGFEVKGTLKQSVLVVFSDPDMSQSDAISYLLFNRPVSEAKSSESAIARETATAIGLQAGSAYTQKMASKVGLDEASLESEGTIQEASLMLGTYLTPSLYARYGIGLFDSANTFQLSYLLSKRWTLKAESSEQNRAGILYTIEPGRRPAK